MGILADFFVATPEDALLYAELSLEDSFPEARFPRAQWKGFTSLEVETLWAIVEGRPWNPETHSLEPAGDVGEEQWLFRLPEPLVARLATLTPEDQGRFAGEWAETEELSCEASELEPVLASLVDLAGNARASGRGMFLWGSL